MNIERISAIELFSTDLFRLNSWVQQLCADLDQVWTTRDKIPHGHFTVYFGVVSVRDWYKNLYIADLYYLHELWHMRLLRAAYDPTASWLDWSRKMITQEMEASLASECWAYLDIEGLRQHTFDHEIWMDRFLKRIPAGDDNEFRGEIRQHRIRAMTTPGFNDFIEEQIWGYRRSNHAFMAIWARPIDHGAYEGTPAFRVVEEAMASGIVDDPDRYHAWLDSVSDEHGIPFGPYAEAFHKVYRQNSELFGNWLLQA